MTRIFVVFIVAAAIAGCSSTTSPPTGGGSGGGGLFVPDTVNFGTLASGQMKDTVISIFNETGAAITITGNSLSSTQAQDTNFTHPVTVAPGYINIHIQFTSASGANTAMDSIRYQSGGRNYVAVILLEANSSSSGGNSGSLFAPKEIDFGMLVSGQWHDTTTVIANTGSAPITIISSSISSSEAQDTNFAQAVTLNGGGYMTIHLQFNPAQAGFRTAVDSIRYVSGGTIHSAGITMTATGTAAASNTPGAGSEFTYDYTSVDTNGITSPVTDSTYTVVSNALTFAGKTNVVEVQSGAGNISYFHLESNGDIAVYVDLSSIPIPIGISSTWFIIPVGSKTAQSNTLFDSTIQYPYNGTVLPVQVMVTSNAEELLGATVVAAAGQTFQSEKGSIAVTFSASFSGLFTLASSVQTTTVWYSKQLKYYPERQDNVVNSGPLLGNTTTSDTYLLKSYTPK